MLFRSIGAGDGGPGGGKGNEAGNVDGVEVDVVDLEGGGDFAGVSLAGAVECFGDQEDNAAAVLLATKHEGGFIDTVVEAGVFAEGGHVLEGGVDFVGVVGEVGQFFDFVMEGEDGRLAFIADKHIAHERAHFLDFGQHIGGVAGALDADNHGEWEEGDIAVDFLLFVVVVEVEVLGAEAVDDIAPLVGDGGGDKDDGDGVAEDGAIEFLLDDGGFDGGGFGFDGGARFLDGGGAGHGADLAGFGNAGDGRLRRDRKGDERHGGEDSGGEEEQQAHPRHITSLDAFERRAVSV